MSSCLMLMWCSIVPRKYCSFSYLLFHFQIRVSQVHFLHSLVQPSKQSWRHRSTRVIIFTIWQVVMIWLMSLLNHLVQNSSYLKASWWTVWNCKQQSRISLIQSLYGEDRIEAVTHEIRNQSKCINIVSLLIISE